jgi:signal transduction histidine kinase
MPASRQSLSTEILSLLSAFAILALAGFVTYRADEHRRQSASSLRHTLEVESALQRFYGALRRVESEERGYLLTRDQQYLNPDADVSARINEALDTVARLVDASPAQSARLAQIRPILKERLDLLTLKIDLTKKGRLNDAIHLLRSGGGKELMDEMDQLISAMISEEELQYRQRDETLQQASRSLQTAIASMILVLVGVVAFTITLAQRQMSALQSSRESLQNAYDRLIEESERREAVEAQLRQSQKLEALGQLAGGVAHDFNNLLGVIVASLNILRRKLQRNEGGYDELIDSALDSADSASGLIKRLLAFSRIQPLAPEPLDANLFVSGMSTMLTRTLGENITLETTLADGLWTTKVDAAELQNAVLNLAVNARDAMPEGGRLLITSRNVHVDSAQALETIDLKPGDYVVVSVSDTGAGMTPDIAGKAFDPFYTTKPPGKGTGLGLSQVHGFVRQSGGLVTIRSAPGAGTTIELYLPRYANA